MPQALQILDIINREEFRYSHSSTNPQHVQSHRGASVDLPIQKHQSDLQGRAGSALIYSYHQLMDHLVKQCNPTFHFLVESEKFQAAVMNVLRRVLLPISPSTNPHISEAKQGDISVKLVHA